MWKALLSGRGLGVFWLGFCLSVLGDAVTRTTLVWFVFERTGSSVALGWLSFCLAAPVVAGGLMAGWLLDRFDRRAIMIGDSLLKGLAVASMPVLAWFDALPYWYVYGAASLLGFLMMIPLAGVPSLLPGLVDKDDLNAANALETIGYTAGGMVGPPLAGFMIPEIGALNVLFIDGGTFVMFAGAVWHCRPQTGTSFTIGTASRGLRAAARIIFGNRVLASTTIMYLVFNIGLGALVVVGPIFAETVLEGGPQLYGILLGCLAAGELAGAVLTGALRLPVVEGFAICLALMASGAGMAMAAASANATIAGAGFALYGVFSAPLTIWGQSLRMKIIPDEYHGRCFAIMRTLMQSGGPIGSLSAGFATPIAGVRAVLAGIALSTCLVGAAGVWVAELRNAR